MRQPNGPRPSIGPDSHPQDAYHNTFGNPTTSHPKVVPMTYRHFTSDAAMLAQLLHQPAGERDPTTAPKELGDPLTISGTTLVITRPEDLQEGLLLHAPSETARQVYKVLESPTSDDRLSDELITCEVMRAPADFRTRSKGTFTMDTYTIELPLSFICDRLSIMVNHMLVSGSDEHPDGNNE